MTRIIVINPNTSAELTDSIVAAAQAVAGAGVTDHRRHPAVGVPSVESHVDEVMGAVGVVEQVRREPASADAYVIACFGDTGVPAAREVATGPVVGMTEAALRPRPDRAPVRRHHAAAAHHRAQRPRGARARPRAPLHRARGRRRRSPSWRTARPTCSTRSSPRRRTAIEADEAEAIVLGCAGLTDLVGPLTEALGVPVIDGVAAAVGMAEGLLAQGLTTSRASTFAARPGLRPAGWSSHDRPVPRRARLRRRRARRR